LVFSITCHCSCSSLFTRHTATNEVIYVVLLHIEVSGQEKDQAKQIFTSSAASGILTNDLVKILQDEKVSGDAEKYLVLQTVACNALMTTFSLISQAYTGCAKKSNPLPFFVNISIMNWNFLQENLCRYFSFISAHICQIMLHSLNI